MYILGCGMIWFGNVLGDRRRVDEEDYVIKKKC